MESTAIEKLTAEYDMLKRQSSELSEEISGLQDRIEALRQERKEITARQTEIVAALKRENAESAVTGGG